MYVVGTKKQSKMPTGNRFQRLEEGDDEQGTSGSLLSQVPYIEYRDPELIASLSLSFLSPPGRTLHSRSSMRLLLD